MVTTIQNVFKTISAYSGCGLYLTIFLLAVLYLFLTESDKGKKVLFCYLSVFVLGIVYFPLTAYFVMNKLMDDQIFYRQLWLLPAAGAVSYAGVRLVSRVGERFVGLKKGICKLISALAIMALLILSGQFVFRGEYFSEAENPYHVPQYVIDVCDTIDLGDEPYSVTAAFPATMVDFVRQYTGGILTPYGRGATVEFWVDSWNMGNPLLSLIEGEAYDAKELGEEAARQHVEVLVLYHFKDVTGDLAAYGYPFYASVDGYDIYASGWLHDFFGK